MRGGSGPGPGNAAAPGKNRLRQVLAGKEPGRRAPLLVRPTGGFLLESYRPDPESFRLDPGLRPALLARLAREGGLDGVLLEGPGPDPAWEGRILETRGEAGLFQVVLEGGARVEFPQEGQPRFFPPGGGKTRRDLEELDPEELFYLDPRAPWAAVRERQVEMKEEGEKGFSAYTEQVKRLAGETGGEVLVAAYLEHPLGQLEGFLGFEGMMELLLAEPLLAKECLQALSLGTRALGRALAGAGAEVLVLGGRAGGAGSLSKNAWAEFVRPVDGDLLGGLEDAARVPVFYEIPLLSADRLGEIFSLGAAGWLAPPPPPKGDLPWEWLVSTWRREGGGILAGGIAPPLLARGTPLEVARAVRLLADSLGRERRWVLAPSGPVESGVPLENLFALAGAFS